MPRAVAALWIMCAIRSRKPIAVPHMRAPLQHFLAVRFKIRGRPLDREARQLRHDGVRRSATKERGPQAFGLGAGQQAQHLHAPHGRFTRGR
eukprot:4178510-Prymnesium_polylepis.1